MQSERWPTAGAIPRHQQRNQSVNRLDHSHTGSWKKGVIATCKAATRALAGAGTASEITHAADRAGLGRFRRYLHRYAGLPQISDHARHLLAAMVKGQHARLAIAELTSLEGNLLCISKIW